MTLTSSELKVQYVEYWTLGGQPTLFWGVLKQHI